MNPETTKVIQDMRKNAIFSDGEISGKFKTLAATLWSINAKCEPCLKFYVLKAKELGATESEMSEILDVACTMGGCVGEMWSLKALEAYKSDEAPAQVCCGRE